MAPPVRCLCGTTFEGTDAEALIPMVSAHVAEVHPELELHPNNIRDFVEASLRLHPVRPRLEAPPEITVHPVGPGREADFLAFFDYEAFADNPIWSACYCAFFLFPGNDQEWGARAGRENRAQMQERIRKGEAHGYLAYANGEVVGWCHAGPRTIFARLERTPEFATEHPEYSGTVVCFLIAPPYRRHGVARALLAAAIEGFRTQGLAHAEGFPRKGEASAAGHYYGPRALYDEFGFEEVGESKYCWVMRLAL